MFDDTYFKEHLLEQIRELGAGCCTVSVQLSDGVVFRIKAVKPDQVYPGYVLLEVYPLEGVSKKSKAKRRKPGPGDEVFYDRVAIPYEYISRVFLSLVVPSKEGESNFVGFPTKR